VSQGQSLKLLSFIEMDGFRKDWSALKLNSDALLELEHAIMRDPEQAPIIAGTGGLRKLRFAPSAWKRGKSGAVRVCYVYFVRFGTVLLLMAYAKNEMDNLSAAGRNEMKALIAEQEAEFAKKFG